MLVYVVFGVRIDFEPNEQKVKSCDGQQRRVTNVYITHTHALWLVWNMHSSVDDHNIFLVVSTAQIVQNSPHHRPKYAVFFGEGEHQQRNKFIRRDDQRFLRFYNMF